MEFTMAMPQDLGELPVRTTSHGDISIVIGPDATTVVLGGEIDLALRDRLDNVADSAVAQGIPIQVETSGVTFIDSTGLRLIAQLAAAEISVGRRVRITGATVRFRDLITVGGLSPVVEYVQDPAA
jgi:anti-sigma B factor antagonist